MRWGAAEAGGEAGDVREGVRRNVPLTGLSSVLASWVMLHNYSCYVVATASPPPLPHPQLSSHTGTQF